MDLHNARGKLWYIQFTDGAFHYSDDQVLEKCSVQEHELSGEVDVEEQTPRNRKPNERSWGEAARAPLSNIRIILCIAVVSFTLLQLTEAFVGAKGAPAAAARTLCALCNLLFAAAMWLIAKKAVLARLVQRARYVRMHFACTQVLAHVRVLRSA